MREVGARVNDTIDNCAARGQRLAVWIRLTLPLVCTRHCAYPQDTRSARTRKSVAKCGARGAHISASLSSYDRTSTSPKDLGCRTGCA